MSQRLIHPEIVLCHHIEDLGMRAAQDFVKRAQKAIAAKGVFRVALSGGNTPKALFKALVLSPLLKEVEWSKVQIFFSDERYVSHDDAASNFKMARDNLLAYLPVQPQQVIAVPTKSSDAHKDAAAYEKLIRTVFGQSTGVPVFDLVYLGLGPEGHTASLFPGTALLQEILSDTIDPLQLVAASYVEKVGMDRITFTPALINHAACIKFLISGADKAPKLHQVLYGPADGQNCPAQLIRPVQGELVIFADMDAAKQL